MLACGCQCGVCIEDVAFSASLVLFLHMCVPISIWSCVHICGWDRVVLGVCMFGAGTDIQLVASGTKAAIHNSSNKCIFATYRVSTLGLSSWGGLVACLAICMNVYGYLSFLICCSLFC